MTDLEFDSSGNPAVTGVELATASTPLRRAAGRLQSALPPGWRVDVAMGGADVALGGGEPGGDTRPILRVLMPKP